MKCNWHPYPKEVPPKDGTYITTVQYTSTKNIAVFSYSSNLYKIDKYDFKKSDGAGWYSYDSEYGYFKVNGIIAWDELPKPYSED
jgi:hypothetical protein